MPTIRGLLETSLYVDDLDRSTHFYQKVIGFERMVGDERMSALAIVGRQVLLLFKKGASTQPTQRPGGTLPGHDGSGQTHVAFAIDAAELPSWEQSFEAHGVVIESRMAWPRGGHSVYFRDPDGHLLELVTPGCWPIY